MLDIQRSKVSKPRSPKKAKKPTSSVRATKAASSALTDNSSNKTTKSPKTQPPAPSSSKPAPTSAGMATTTRTIPLPALKDLASSDPSLRRKSLTTVLTHLETRTLDAPLTPTRSQQLWRAFYIALYMHDSKSAVSVQNLARTLAGTLRTFWEKDAEIQSQSKRQGQKAEGEAWAWSAGWATAFWNEIAGEWAGVDQWRMNKVLMLVRFFVGEGVALAQEGAASAAQGEKEEQGKAGDSAWRDFVADVVALPLEVERSLPDGLRMHVLDVWGDEIEKVIGMADDEDGDENGEDESHVEEHRKEVARMLTMAAKELSVFRQGEANVPRNVRARAKEIVQKSEV